MPNANQAVKFIACTSASYTALGIYNDNTIYFCTDTQQIFLGSREYTKSIKVLDAQPTAATVGENGRMYVYNGNLYMCQISGYTYIWTRIANVNDDNGTVISVKAGSGLNGGTITESGTISHAVPTGAKSSSDNLGDAAPTFGDSFQIIGVQTDEFGHITGVNLHNVTLPEETSVSVSTSAGDPETLDSDGSFTVVTGIAKGSTSHGLEVTTKQFTLPAELDTTYTITKGSTDGTIKVTPSKGDPYEVEVEGWENVAKLSDISAVFRYKGAVETIDDLPATAQTGDVYSVESEGNQYVYAEDSGWSKFGATVDLTPYAKKANVIPRVEGVDGEVPKFDSDGTLVTTGYTLGKSVPSNAKFTDTVYNHPEFTPHGQGLYKIQVDEEGHVSNAVKVQKSDITALGIPGENTDTEVKTNPNTTGRIYLAGATTKDETTGELEVNPKVYAEADGSLKATAFHGNADTATKADTADEATKAIQDEDGNSIKDTYATKQEIVNSATVWEVI